MFEAKLNVNVSKLQLSSELKRMRFVVSPVKINNQIKDRSSAKSFEKIFNPQLRSMLVKSNRFALLDRKNSKEIDKEINFIKGSNVRTEELAKLVFSIPSSCAFVVIKIANSSSVPAIPSANATHASLPEATIIPLRRFSTDT